MSGFMGVGQSKTEKEGLGKMSNIFNWSLPQAKTGQAEGQGALGQAQKYFSGLVRAGRTQAAANAAPALQATQAQTDATKRQEAAMGTSRSGGTAGAAREATSTSGKSMDDILAATLVGGREAGAKGLESTGKAQLDQAFRLLGLSEQGAEATTQAALTKEQMQTKVWGDIISLLMSPIPGGGSGGGGGRGGGGGAPPAIDYGGGAASW